MAARIQSLPAGSSNDPTVNAIIDFSKKGFGDIQMFGLLARRPELLKRAAVLFAYVLAGEGGLIEPELPELMRLRGANLSACTYCATVRLLPVANVVKSKAAALGLRDIVRMRQPQAVAALKDTLQKDELSPREAAAITLVDRIIVDPHSVDDKLFAQLGQRFSEEEIIELICSSSLFTWAGTLNTAMRVETGSESPYGNDLTYAG